jgi:hypothetical protein
MGNRRSKGGLQVAAFIAYGQLDQRPFVAVYDLLDVTDKAIQFHPGVLVAFVIDAAITQEEGDSRAKLC